MQREALRLLDRRNRIGPMMPIVASEMTVMWTTIAICFRTILNREVLRKAKKALHFDRVNSLTEIVGLVVVVVVGAAVVKGLAK